MSYLDALWLYQQADQKVDQFEATIRQNPMRKKLVRLRNFYKEQQDAMRAVESGTEKAAQGVSQAQAQLAQLLDALNTMSAGFSEGEELSFDNLRAHMGEANALLAKMAQLKQRVDDVARQCVKLEADLKTARVNAAKAKNDYTQLKERYDSEFAVQSQTLDGLKAERDQNLSGIPKEAIKRYQAIKLRCAPAMAVLDGDKCGGCNMSLPALILSNAKKAERIVECETCGRIIYIR